MDFSNVVVPGQVIAVSSSSADDSFLRGHGTYIETVRSSNSSATDGTNSESVTQLRSAVVGTVQRVNKLVSVEPVALHTYLAHVGDLIVGRVVALGNARWTVDMGHGVLAALPLSGVHLPGSIQRVKTATDALEMQQFIAVGDLVSCEVHKVLSSTNCVLHTRSVRYGKLENGGVVHVPPRLIPRRKTHYTTLLEERFQVLLGCNGMIWLQRNNHQSHIATATASTNVASAASESKAADSSHPPNELAEAEEERRRRHAATSYSRDDRRDLARLVQAVTCLRRTLTEITPSRIEDVYTASLPYAVADMVLHVVSLTASCRV